MKIGVTLPQFRAEGETAVQAARDAEALGLDGVFVFNHLWPMGSPERPILAAQPLLGALAAETERISIGSFVMRVGLVPDDVLVEQVSGLSEMSGGRFIAGLGTGDHLSADENLAYGVPYPPAAERRASLEHCARTVRDLGIPVWIGAGSVVKPATRAIALRVGAVLNLWETQFGALQPDPEVELSWGGPVKGDAEEIAAQLRTLEATGVTWAVCAWPDSLSDVAAAKRLLLEGNSGNP